MCCPFVAALGAPQTIGAQAFTIASAECRPLGELAERQIAGVIDRVSLSDLPAPSDVPVAVGDSDSGNCGGPANSQPDVRTDGLSCGLDPPQGRNRLNSDRAHEMPELSPWTDRQTDFYDACAGVWCCCCRLLVAPAPANGTRGN